MFVIEKGIPVPDSSCGRKPVYPFSAMQVGDSFLVASGHFDKVRTAASNYGRRNGLKFATRKGDAGVRVWRVA